MEKAIEIILLILTVALSSYVLAKSCDSFEGAADFLGRKLPPGVKGATINAVGSSLPELFTTIALLFFIGGNEVFGAGIAVTAGSAVFNSDIIPCLCIVVVTAPLLARSLFRLATLGFLRLKSEWHTTDSFEIDKPALIRDGIAVLIAEAVLIYLLGKSTLTWVDGAILMAIYLPYVGLMAWQSSKFPSDHNDDEETEETEEVEAKSKQSIIKNLVTFDFNNLYFGGKPYEPSKSYKPWVVLISSILVISGACYVLGETIVTSAELLGVHAIVTALFLGAAASSVPDTILSVKDSMKGNHNDAISNAVGSNTFDICVALGFPLFLYGLTEGTIPMPEHDSVLGLRIALVVVTSVILATFLIPKKVRFWQAIVLAILYVIWTAYILATELKPAHNTHTTSPQESSSTHH